MTSPRRPRGKTTPASTAGSFTAHAHAAGEVDLLDHTPSPTEKIAARLTQEREQQQREAARYSFEDFREKDWDRAEALIAEVSAMPGTEDDLRSLADDLDKATSRQFSIGLVGVRLKGILGRHRADAAPAYAVGDRVSTVVTQGDREVVWSGVVVEADPQGRTSSARVRFDNGKTSEIRRDLLVLDYPGSKPAADLAVGDRMLDGKVGMNEVITRVEHRENGAVRIWTDGNPSHQPDFAIRGDWPHPIKVVPQPPTDLADPDVFETEVTRIVDAEVGMHLPDRMCRNTVREYNGSDPDAFARIRGGLERDVRSRLGRARDAITSGVKEPATDRS